MKIRNGFVSNSSSSSFLIYGVEIEDNSKLLENLKLTEEEIEAFKEEGSWYIGELLEKKGIKGLEFYTIYDDYNYLGCSWDSVGDDETGREFKDRVENNIKRLLGDDTKCSTISEAWQD